MDRRFSAAGGLGSLLNLYEQVRRELERVSFEELDRMTLEIKTVIEALLKMDYELRKVHNLKLAFETRPPGAGALESGERAPRHPPWYRVCARCVLATLQRRHLQCVGLQRHAAGGDGHVARGGH